MFLDNLSASIRRLCAIKRISYEVAAEKCNISARYFGEIARGKTTPSIATLEKICIGFNLTPNDLLLETIYEEQHQIPMFVTHVRCFRESTGIAMYPICPRCSSTIEREYQQFCIRCGQSLDWSNIKKASIVPPRE